MDRSETIARVKKRSTPWDIIIIGGGATGVGCALDGASRGHDTLLLEQHDFGKGTSSRSTKLIHGGVRYLKQGNISLVREALKERFILLKNAPDVAHIQQFVVPCYGFWDKFLYGCGLKIYDLLAGKYSIGASRILSATETLRILPNIYQEGLRGGILYRDGQFDDTRLLVNIARTATANGASLLNCAKVTSIAHDTSNRVTGVEFTDTLSGENLSVAGKAVINATGAFCDSVRSMSDKTAKPLVTFSRGVHIVLDNRFLSSDVALMIPKTSDGRILFCIPWHGYVLVGTTDTLVDSAVLEPEASAAEIDFILDTAADYLTEIPRRSDILSVFAGIRPLIKSSKSTKTPSLSRGHDLFVDETGLITITGGKWTTYRRMAQDTVDRAIDVGKLDPRPAVTTNLAILSPANDFLDKELLNLNLQYTVGDVIRAVRSEMAQTVEDVLARRTRILFLDARTALELAPKVAEIMATELGKDNEWINEQLQSFRTVAANYLPKSRGDN